MDEMHPKEIPVLDLLGPRSCVHAPAGALLFLRPNEPPPERKEVGPGQVLMVAMGRNKLKREPALQAVLFVLWTFPLACELSSLCLLHVNMSNSQPLPEAHTSHSHFSAGRL